MKIIHVRYHSEGESWWAESEDLRGWTAVGSSFEEVREMARTGVAEFAGQGAAVEEVGIPIQSETTFAGLGESTGTVVSEIRGGAVLSMSHNVVPALPAVLRTQIRNAEAITDSELAQYIEGQACR